MSAIRYIVLCIVLLSCRAATAQEIANLAEGEWYKISVSERGVYKIDHGFLRSLGIDPAGIDPSEIKLFGNRGGMLPQANAAYREAGLMENAIFVQGDGDGRFDPGDFILFYADGPDRVEFDEQRRIFYYENNLYDDRNFYFLTFGNGEGKRILPAEDAGQGFPVVAEFNDFVYHELDEYNDQRSGREWFGEKFGVSTTEHTFALSIEGISESSPIRIVSDVMGQSHTNASFNLFFNDVPVGSQDVVAIPNSRYGVKGVHRRDTFDMDPVAAGVSSRVDHNMTYRFAKGTGFSQAYLDFFLVAFERKLRLYGDQTIFLSAGSLENPVSQFEVSSFPAGGNIWDITDPYNVRAQVFSVQNEKAEFSTTTDQLKTFIVFNEQFGIPQPAGKVAPQNLRDRDSPDMIIVTHPNFRDQALRLATHRESFSQWEVDVVTTEEVFNEFSGGRQDVTAVRDLARHYYNDPSSKLKALLLFGKASYDYKDRVSPNTNYVITYESRNSLHPLQTYSSDDYFGFLEENEGEWREGSSPLNHSLDIGVGRLPVRSPEEAQNIVDKIIDYEVNSKAFGYWRKRVVFVADDGNSVDGFDRLHQSQADQLATFAENSPAGVDTEKLFMGIYPKTIKPNGESVPALSDDIVRAFDRGALIINYTGHGSEIQWADENIFNNNTINELDNHLYPFLVTATCEFGRHDDPLKISGAEYAVNADHAGAIGMVTTARDVSAISNFNLNNAFYEALFQREGNRYEPVGDVFRRTKNNSTSGVSNRNFSLLADPSMTLALPPHMVVITQLNTANGSDTLKALSTVTVSGEIRNFSGEKISAFNGKLVATLFDKRTGFVTTGKNDPAFSFEQWDNALFRGQATVKNGAFTLTFLMPKNISYILDDGRFSVYAADTTRHTDASGTLTGFKVGGTENGVATEAQAPSVSLFIGDTTFVNGGVTNPDTYLVARLDDDSGINISNYGIGNSIVAVMDEDEEVFILNDYYLADPDDPTSGWIRFPLRGLAPGKHTIRLTAWDVFNNAGESAVDFIVTDGKDVVIETFGNYPNPFTDQSVLFFTHNRSGDDLQARLIIQNTGGEVIKTLDLVLPASPYHVELTEVNADDFFGKKLPAGLYLARLILRSLSNGSKYERVTKLIILN